MMYAPCIIKADFESKDKKYNKSYDENMHKLGEQISNNFCYTVHWIDTGEVWGPFTYRGQNATQEFVKGMDNELVKINKVLAINNDIRDDKNSSEYLIAKEKFDTSTKCWICGKEFDFEFEKVNQSWIERPIYNKVWDHNHITGKYRGAAHNNYNLQLQIQLWKTPIPIVFHNFRGYDSHLVCESVGQSVNAHQITVIAETFEWYKSMKVGQMKYIDSYQFMRSDLAQLANNLGVVKCKDTNCNYYHRIDNN